jgi:hypothetical protein
MYCAGSEPQVLGVISTKEVRAGFTLQNWDLLGKLK